MLEAIENEQNINLDETDKSQKNFIINGIEANSLDELDNFDFSNISNVSVKVSHSSNDNHKTSEKVEKAFCSELGQKNNNVLNKTSHQTLNVEHNENEIEDSTSNCDITSDLALSVSECKKIVSVKNVFLHSLKITWKVIVSTAILTILKILL